MIDLTRITLGQYAARKSTVHQLDPRSKLLLCMIWMILIFQIKSLWIMALCVFLVCVLFRAAKLGLDLAFRNIQSFLILLLLTFFIHALFTKGETLVQYAPLGITVTLEGVMQGLFYLLRLIIFILMANLLTLTTSPMELTDAIEKLLSPFRRFRVPAHEIAMMMSLALRFIPILLEEMLRIQKAQASRGARFSGSIIARIRHLIPILIPLFISTFRRANDLAMAMDARCYRGGENRTSFHQLKFTHRDWAAFGLSAVFGVFFIINPYG